jgi:hypothetical protein
MTEMTSISQASVSAEKTRAVLLPAAVATLIFAALMYLQFSNFLGQLNFIAQLPLGIGFYYCWAWHTRLSKRAAAHEARLKQ